MERKTELEGSPESEKSAAASLRSEEQSENLTDHPNYWYSHQKTRRLDGGWALRPLLRRLVPGNGLVWAVQRLLGELGTGQSGWQGRDHPRGLGSRSLRLAGQRLPGSLESGASWVEGAIL